MSELICQDCKKPIMVNGWQCTWRKCPLHHECVEVCESCDEVFCKDHLPELEHGCEGDEDD